MDASCRYPGGRDRWAVRHLAPESGDRADFASARPHLAAMSPKRCTSNGIAERSWFSRFRKSRGCERASGRGKLLEANPTLLESAPVSRCSALKREPNQSLTDLNSLVGKQVLELLRQQLVVPLGQLTQAVVRDPEGSKLSWAQVIDAKRRHLSKPKRPASRHPSLFLCSNTAATMSSSANTGATAAMSGITLEPTPPPVAARSSWRCTQP